MYIVSTHFVNLSFVILHFPHFCNFPLIPSLVFHLPITYFFFPVSVLPLKMSVFFVSVELELSLYWILSPLLQ